MEKQMSDYLNYLAHASAAFHRNNGTSAEMQLAEAAIIAFHTVKVTSKDEEITRLNSTIAGLESKLRALMDGYGEPGGLP